MDLQSSRESGATLSTVPPRSHLHPESQVQGSRSQDLEQATLLEELSRWGDRTSSLMTAYPGFESFRAPGIPGVIRFARVAEAPGQAPNWVGATEPISPPECRAALGRAFFETAQQKGAQALILPISEQLCEQLSTQLQTPRSALCVGAEPIFELDEDRFSLPLSELLSAFPRSRSLLRKGYRVVCSSGISLTASMREALFRIEKEWKASLRSEPMGFLNQVDPLYLSDSPYKLYFFLQSPLNEEIEACLTALKVSPDSWYFSEVLRARHADHGAMPLLLFGAMQTLRARAPEKVPEITPVGVQAKIQEKIQEKIQDRVRSNAPRACPGMEVRLGLSPLAYSELEASYASQLRSSWAGRLLLKLSEQDSWLYGFRSSRDFKKRLRPSRWDPLFLQADRAVSLRTLLTVANVHFPRLGAGGALQQALHRKIERRFWPNLPASMRALFEARPRALPTGTVGLALVLLLLHAARSASGGPAVSPISHVSAMLGRIFEWGIYSPGQPTGRGWLLSPFFHNHAYHLWGDVLSFLAFGCALEWLAGRAFFLLVTAFGFWATNPMADLTVRALHTWGVWVSDPAWERFLAEQDRGSSNAVYAFVGALAAWTRPQLSLWLLLPFAANGIYLCWVKQSWLSLHHLVGLFGGYGLGRLWLVCGSPPKRSRN